MDGTALLPNLLGVLTPLLLQTVAHGQFFSFVHGSIKSKACSSDRDCDVAGGMVCWWLYEGCYSGQCMCDPRTHVIHPSGRCVRVRQANEACDGFNDTCSDMLTCINGTCRCPHSQQQQQQQQQQQPLSSLCIHPNSRPLGAKCNPSIHVCYHESAYGLAELVVECSRRGICQCKEGYKQHGRTCRRLHIWETGCKRDYDCEGGAVCVDEQCACPTGYKSVAGNTKCAKTGATLELPLTARCDEINERRYCSKGLVCHRCKPNEALHICARYSPGFEVGKSSLQSASSILLPRQRMSLIVSLIFCVHLVLVMR